jgi:hypothetical protein
LGSGAVFLGTVSENSVLDKPERFMPKVYSPFFIAIFFVYLDDPGSGHHSVDKG